MTFHYFKLILTC